MKTLVLLLISACCSHTFATTIITNNTGVNPGTVGAVDASWFIVELAQNAVVTDEAADGSHFPFNFWLSAGVGSKWVSPHALYGPAGEPAGLYTFRALFDLTGMNPSTTRIRFRYIVDDWVADVLINGASTRLANGYGFASQIQFSPEYEISTVTGVNFLAGLNRFEVVVGNIHISDGEIFNPVGIRLEWMVTADPIVENEVTHSPEPSTLAAVGSGLVALSVWRRRRR